MGESGQRERFLENVRSALEGGEPTRSKSAVELKAPPMSHTPQRIEALIEKFTLEAEAVSAQVHLAADAGEAREHLKAIARRYDAKLAVQWNDPLLMELGVAYALKESEVETITADLRMAAGDPEGEPSPEKVEEARVYLIGKLAEADLGVSGVDCAIAETGTLALIVGEGQGRSVTLLPPVHVAVLDSARLVETVGEFLTRTVSSGEDGRPTLESCISFITGPSRTADIELALTIGVHGPRHVHVIILRGGSCQIS